MRIVSGRVGLDREEGELKGPHLLLDAAEHLVFQDDGLAGLNGPLARPQDVLLESRHQTAKLFHVDRGHLVHRQAVGVGEVLVGEDEAAVVSLGRHGDRRVVDKGPEQGPLRPQLDTGAVGGFAQPADVPAVAPQRFEFPAEGPQHAAAESPMQGPRQRRQQHRRKPDLRERADTCDGQDAPRQDGGKHAQP